MTPSTDTSLPKPGAANPNATLNLQWLGADIVFTHDVFGQYLSFYWESALRHGITAEAMLGKSMEESFTPALYNIYLERVKRILANLVPEKFKFPFCYGEQSFLFELIVSPIIMSNGTATVALVMGRLLSQAVGPHPFEIEEETSSSDRHLDSKQYPRLLNHIARNIRRTLDLTTIWEQTVKGLGKGLGASRCIICPYRGNTDNPPVKLKAVAEYISSPTPLEPMRGLDFKIDDLPYWSQALVTQELIVVEKLDTQSPFGEKSLLVVPACHQNNPNALIVLHQCDRTRPWSPSNSSIPTALTRMASDASVTPTSDRSRGLLLQSVNLRY